MKFKFLTEASYEYAAEHIDEVLKKRNRPYGYLHYSYQDLDFLIPLRSHLNPNEINKKFALSYETNENVSKGLDLTKVLIVTDRVNVAINSTYWLKNRDEFNFYNDREKIIKDMLEKMIEKYIHICGNLKKMIDLNDKIGNVNTLRKVLLPYRYSTLINYHHELGIKLTKEEMLRIFEIVYNIE